MESGIFGVSIDCVRIGFRGENLATSYTSSETLITRTTNQSDLLI
jgi:hypothetical protein